MLQLKQLIINKLIRMNFTHEAQNSLITTP